MATLETPLKNLLHIKALVVLLAVALIFFGVSEADSDPQLRVLKDVTMAQIEAGKLPTGNQYVRIKDAHLLPVWVTSTVKSRRHGTHSNVYVGLGSAQTLDAGLTNKVARVALWLKLHEEFPSESAANEAMKRPQLYGKAVERVGILYGLPDGVLEKVNEPGSWPSGSSSYVSEGQVPSTKGHGVGLVAAGVLLLVLVAGWLASDHVAERWRAQLIPAGAAPAQLFAGNSPWMLLLVIGGLVAPVLIYIGVEDWVDGRHIDVAILLGLLAVLGAMGFALSRNRVALIVNEKGLAKAGPTGMQRLLRWEEVDGVSVQQWASRGFSQSTQILHRGSHKIKTGAGFFQGGVVDHLAYGRAVREQVMRHLSPKIIARLDAGERVSFGPIGACREGLIKGSKVESGELLTWSDLEKAEIANGKLKIKRRGKLLGWDSMAVSKVRNLDLLVMLINEPVRAPAGAAAASAA